jgi:hypothetical protein
LPDIGSIRMRVMKRWEITLAVLAAVAALTVGVLSVVGPPAPDAGASPAAHQAESGYWLVTGWGTSYA